MEAYVPYTIKSFSPSKPWFDNACSRAVQARERAYQTFIHSRSDLTFHAFIATLESSREELEEKREPKRLAFSAGETAIVPSARKRGGKPDLQKFLEMLLVRTRKSY